MNITRYMSVERLWFLLKRDFRRQWKDYLVTMGGLCGPFLIIMIINAKTGTISPSIHYAYMSLILYVLGPILTSMAFRDAHKKLLNHDWLMLPASTLEKFIDKLVFYAAVFPVVSIAVYTVFTLVARLVIQVILGEYYPWFNPFDYIIWKMVLHYIIAQSVFLLGAAWFKSNNFIKTLLALFVVSMIISLLSALIGWIVFNDYFWVLVREDFHVDMNLSDGFNTEQLENFGYGILNTMKIIYYGFLAPVCWFGAWLKLKEVEVKDGV